MKKEITEKAEEEVLRSYPIKGNTTGWFFRSTETSNNAWEVEGTDKWGRKVSRQGNDPYKLIAECEKAAEGINKAIRNT
jgi:hypothetical protein